jgi:hypothetical protein
MAFDVIHYKLYCTGRYNKFHVESRYVIRSPVKRIDQEWSRAFVEYRAERARRWRWMPTTF